MALVYVPYLALGRALPHSPSALFAGLPSDIVSFATSRSVAAQCRDWLASTAPSDAPWLFFAALFAWALDAAARPRRSGLVRRISAFFFLGDPHNRFVYAASLLFPVVVCALAERRRWVMPACAAIWVALLAQKPRAAPDYLPP